MNFCFVSTLPLNYEKHHGPLDGFHTYVKGEDYISERVHATNFVIHVMAINKVMKMLCKTSAK